MAINDNDNYTLTGAQVKDLASEVNKKVEYTDIEATTPVPPITTGLIQDNAVTNAKMDWSTIPIETGRSELLTIQHDSYVDKAFTFTKTFTTPPVVSVTMRGDAAHVPSTGELLVVVTDHITTTGFTARIFNPYNTGDRQMYIDYIAVGI